MAKKKRSRTVLMIGIISLLTIGSWAGFEVYRGFTNTTLTRVLQQQIKPLPGEVDSDFLDRMRGRRDFSESELLLTRSRSVEELENKVVEVAISPTPTEALATPSAELSPAPEGTESSQ